MNVLCVSYGNDSIALIQAAYEAGMRDVHTLYNDTGWASKDWETRVIAGEAFARDCGFKPHRTISKGMVALVLEKNAWPRQGIQFCTEELKINPSIAWLAENDPDGMATLYNGKRRAESKNRANIPLYTLPEHSPLGRLTISPLYKHSDEERNELIRNAGFDVLPHRSKECNPCVNAKRADILALESEEIDQLEPLETHMGFTRKGKPRTIFRPYRYMGATGIRAIVQWAKSPRGQYAFDLDDGNGTSGCDSGMCGG